MTNAEIVPGKNSDTIFRKQLTNFVQENSEITIIL